MLLKCFLRSLLEDFFELSMMKTMTIWAYKFRKMNWNWSSWWVNIELSTISYSCTSPYLFIFIFVDTSFCYLLPFVPWFNDKKNPIWISKLSEVFVWQLHFPYSSSSVFWVILLSTLCLTPSLTGSFPATAWNLVVVVSCLFSLQDYNGLSLTETPRRGSILLEEQKYMSSKILWMNLGRREQCLKPAQGPSSVLLTRKKTKELCAITEEAYHCCLAPVNKQVNTNTRQTGTLSTQTSGKVTSKQTKK